MKAEEGTQVGIHWTVEQIPDLHGQLAVVTGANSGTGWETTRALAQRGAQVVMAVRSVEKGKTARDAILRESPDSNIEVMELDLSSLASIRQFSDRFVNRFSSISLLINNAGVMGVPYTKTKDGFELQFGTNHLGHFALTGHLFPVLLASGNLRAWSQSAVAPI